MEERRIVVAGSGGRLGAALHRTYGAETQCLGMGHAEMDLGLNEAVEVALGSLDFDVLINCAALTAVDYCEDHEEEAFQVNVAAVRRMAEICARKKAKFVHTSTDYVFDGEKPTPYVEDDPAEPISVYGHSKRQGEKAALEVSDKHLVVRVSWVFGPDRPSFLDMIVKRALENDAVEAIADKSSTPTYTLDVADLLRPLLAPNTGQGILHLCNGGGCTWQEYGDHAVRCAAEAGMPVKAKSVGAIQLSDLKDFVAKRPVNTVMSTAKYTALTGMEPRPWQEAVKDYVTGFLAARVA